MSLVAEPVRTRRDRRDFVGLPYRLHSCQPCWLPQMRSDEMRRFDPTLNPSLQQIENEHFVVRDRRGVPRARICAMVDPEHRARFRPAAGQFGCFEAESAAAAAVAIVAAMRWLAARGVAEVIGPFSHRSTEDAGLLIEGFDQPARLLQTWNPPAYLDYLRQSGFEIDFTMAAWQVEVGQLDAAALRHGEQSARAHAAGVITRRIINPPFSGADYATIAGLFNATFEGNQDVVRLSTKALEFHTAPLMPLMRKRHVAIFERDGEPVAFVVAIPDLSTVLRGFGGRLSIGGLLRLPFRMKSVDTLMIALIGAPPGRAAAGAGRLLAQEIFCIGRDFGYRSIETMWIDDRNSRSKAIARSSGMRPVKRYAILKAPLPIPLPLAPAGALP